MKRRNLFRILIWLAMTAASWVLVSLCGGVLPWLIFYVCILLLPLSLFYLFYVSICLKIWQDIEHRPSVAGKHEGYRFLLENSGFLPIVKIHIRYDHDCADISGIDEDLYISLMPKEQFEQKGTALCLYAGVYDIGAVSATVPDPFGLFVWSIKIKNPCRVNMLPQIKTDSAVLSAIMGMTESGAKKAASKISELPGTLTRPYQAGDRPRTIAWKSYAKTGDLLTRIPDPEEISRILVCLVPDEKDMPSKPEERLPYIRRRSAFLTFAASLGAALCRNNIPLVMRYPRGEWEQCTISGWKDFQPFYYDLASGLYLNDPENNGISDGTPDDSMIIIREADFADTDGVYTLKKETHI